MATSSDVHSTPSRPDLAALSPPILRRVAASWPTVLIALLLIARLSVTFFRAEFWAEDGAIFFPESFELGIRSLWKPVTGYQLFISRCIAYAATFLPAITLPYTYAVGSLVFCSIAFSYFARDGFSWLVASRGYRILICCALAVGPGTSEVVFNLSNLQAPLTFWFGLLLLEKPFRLGPLKLALLTLIFVSSGSTAIWIPLLAYLGWTTKQKRYGVLIVLQVLVVVANIVSHHHFDATSGIAPYASYGTLFSVPRVYGENFFTRLFFAPFLGQRGTAVLMKASPLVYWGTAVLCLATLVFFWRRFSVAAEKRQALLLAYLCSLGLLALVAVVRAYNLPILLREHGDLFWNGRYGFLPGCFSLLFWASWFLDDSEKRSRVGRWAGRLALAVPLFWYLSYRKEVPVRPYGQWPVQAAKLQAVLDAKRTGTLREPVTIGGIVLQPLAMATTQVTISP